MGIIPFWWRQFLLAALVFAGVFVFEYHHFIHYGHSNITAIFPLFIPACAPLLFAFMQGDSLSFEAAMVFLFEHQLFGPGSLPADAAAHAAMTAAFLLLTLAFWCSTALILRRLRDMRGGLRWLPVCMPGLFVGALYACGVGNEYMGAVALLLILTSTLLFCRPSRESERVLLANELLLSFISPCGRLGRAGFWKRQLVLAPIVWLGSFACCLGQLMREGVCVFSALRTTDPLPEIAMCISSSTLPNLCMFGWGSVEAENLSSAFYGADALHSPLSGGELLALGLALLLPAAWCTLAQMLRRLRDTRPGVWGLPLCLPQLCCALLAELTGAKGIGMAILWYAFIALTQILLLLPTAQAKPTAPTEP